MKSPFRAQSQVSLKILCWIYFARRPMRRLNHFGLNCASSGAVAPHPPRRFEMLRSLPLSPSPRPASGELSFHSGNQQSNVGGLHDVIVHFRVNGFQSGLEPRISRQQNSYTIGIGIPHRSNYGESVAFLTDVDVAEQHIEIAALN